MKTESFLASIAVGLIRLVFLTIRLEVDDRCGFGRNEPPGPLVLCFWHNRILAISLSFLRRYLHRERKGVAVLTSPSRDGEILAQAMLRLGMGSVRGSSSRRGSQALRQLVRLIGLGFDIAITPDGPRGPRYKLGPGAILLAQTTGAPIVMMHARFSRAFQMKTWDGFMVPYPFSTITVIVEKPLPVPSELTSEEFEAIRNKVETTLKNEAN